MTASARELLNSIRGGIQGQSSRSDRRHRFTPEENLKGLRLGVESRQRSARAFMRELRPMAVELRGMGLTLDAVARVMNADGKRTRQGKEFTRTTVLRILNSAE